MGRARRLARLLAGTALAGASLFATEAAAQCNGTTCEVNDSGDGAGSLANPTLRFAIDHANANPGTTITFSSTIAGQIITLASELPLILGNNTSINGGTNNIAVSGGSGAQSVCPL